MVQEYINITEEKLKKLREETRVNTTIQAVVELVRSGWPEKKS